MPFTSVLHGSVTINPSPLEGREAPEQMARLSHSGQLPVARRPLLLSLRARLIASHGAVILLALALVVAISAAMLRRYEASAERERLRLVARTLTIQTNFLGRRTAPSAPMRIELVDAQAEEFGVRLIVLRDDGTVVYDSDKLGSLEGQTLLGYGQAVRELLGQADRRRGIQTQFVEPGGDDDPFAGHDVLLAAGGAGRQRTALALVTPERRFPLLGRFLPRLLGVTAISLAAASLAGYALSQRIAAPVRRLTEAADAMASGALEQQVPGAGPDEIGRLVASFNSMSRQVAAMARSQRQLLANVAHELRTPLTSVQGYAQALRDGVIASEAEQEQALATIGRESERIASLVGQLLDLARLESGQASLRLGAVPVEPLLAGIVERFTPEATRNAVRLETAGGDDLAIRGDQERLVQILSNLVANAIRHTPAGGRIRIAAARSGARVRLTVADTGEGIPADRLPAIFDRFVRGDRDGSDRTGFGLGLAIVKELVELHGGAITVASEVGRGTTFTVDLPAAPAPEWTASA